MTSTPDEDQKPGLPAPRNRAVFDTALLPERERLPAWQEQITRNIAAFELVRLGDEPFYGRIERLDFGPVRVHREDCAAVRWRRSARQIKDGVETFSLFLGRSGPFAFQQGAVDGQRDVGHYAVTDHSRDSDLYVTASGTDYDIVVQREMLTRSQRDPNRIAQTALGPQTATLKLLRHYIDSVLAESSDLADPLICQKIGEHIVDLVVLGLQPKPDAQAEAMERGLRSARFRAILDVIRSCFREEGISAALVAARLNISERYLHRLMEERGLTFSHYVMELRLRQAAALLTDPTLDRQRIGQIAYACGFSDLSYFNRCFRRRFGDTPAGIRSGRTVAL